MKLQTVIEISKSQLPLDYSEKIMLVGSCFVENIGRKLAENKFQVDVNPFGVLYNPLSIARTIEHLMESKIYTDKDIFEHKGLYHSFDHHSKFSHEHPIECINRINQQIELSSKWLKNANRLIITFGTSYVYFIKKENNVVGNCHKLPDKEFDRRRIPVDEIVKCWTNIIEQLKSLNPDLKILFTVSPIRHWKDGAHENQLSKATLLLAIDQLIRLNANCSYFEAYEIMMDELRDYRFYAEDMIHPSNQAIEYIWNRFVESQLSNTSVKAMQEWQNLNSSINHRPLHPKSETYRQFLIRNKKLLTDFTEKYPYFVVSNELEQINEQLKTFDQL